MRVLFAIPFALLLACTTVKPPPETVPAPAPRPEPDPTFGICTEQLPKSASIDDELLRAKEAIGRGCPREALRRLARIEERLGLSDKQEAVFQLIANEAKVDINTLGFDRYSPTMDMVEETREPWLTLKTPHTGGMLPDVLYIAAKVADGTLPSETRDSGDMGVLFARTMPYAFCADLRAKTAADAVVLARKIAVRSPTPAEWEGIRPKDDLGAAWALAALEFGNCNQKEASNVLLNAQRELRGAGRLAESQDAGLLATEGLFPGQRASDLDAPTLSTKDLYSKAAHEEISQGEDSLRRQVGHSIEDAIRGLLAVFEPGSLTAATRSRALFLRAVLALRLLDDPKRSQDLASKAIDEGEAAQRADLVDAGRAVLALALADAGSYEQSHAQFRVLTRSLARRGALGARYNLIGRITNYAAILQARGKIAHAIDLLKGALPLTEGGSFDNHVLVGALVHMLLQAGRAEEALLTHEEAAAELQSSLQRSSYTAESRRLVLQSSEMLRTSILGALGREAEAQNLDAALDLTSEQRRLAAALRQGDEAAIDAILREPAEDTAQVALDIGLLEAGLCDKVGPRIRDVANFMAAALTVARDSQGSAAALDVNGEIFGKDQSGGHMLSLVPMFAMSTIECAMAQGETSLIEPLIDVLTQAIDAYRGSATSRALRDLTSVTALERKGKHLEAAEAALVLARGSFKGAGSGPLGGVGRSQLAQPFYDKAAINMLRASPPQVERAVAIMEESRARDLRGARAINAARAPSAGALGEVTEAERGISQRQARLRALAELERNIDDPEAKRRLRAIMETSERDLSAWQDRLDAAARRVQASNPAVYQNTALAPPLSLAEIKRRLRPDESLVYYLFSRTQRWAIVIDAQSERAVRLPGGSFPLRLLRSQFLLGERLRSGRGMFVSSAPAAPSTAKAAEEAAAVRADLYEMLIRPIEPFIPEGRRLLIVPDASMANLPLASLGPARRPLIARNPLRVLPGAFALADTPRNDAPVGDALIVGDPELKGRTAENATRGSIAGYAWRPLKGTREEATSVAQMLGAQPLLGAAATEAAITSRMPSAAIVHFASHGIADVARPSFAALILATPQQGSGEDGILHAYEVERLHLRASLVVLSACETGLGQPRGTEGMLALDRSFLVAGAKAVVSSMWAVDYASTKAMMEAFYREFRRAPADVALAKAMNTVRADPRWADPYYWSAFRIVGSGMR